MSCPDLLHQDCGEGDQSPNRRATTNMKSANLDNTCLMCHTLCGTTGICNLLRRWNEPGSTLESDPSETAVNTGQVAGCSGSCWNVGICESARHTSLSWVTVGIWNLGILECVHFWVTGRRNLESCNLGILESADLLCIWNLVILESANLA